MAVDVANGASGGHRERSTSGVIRFDGGRIVAVVWALPALAVAGGIAREVAAVMAGVPSPNFGHQMVNLDSEANFPTAVSALLMVFAALLLFVQARRPGVTTSPDRMRWLILSGGFLYLAMDEVAQFHEQFKAPLRAMAQFDDWLSFAWVVVAIPVVFVLGAYYLPLLFRLPARIRLGLAASGALYVAGAIGMEMVGGRLATYSGWGSSYYVTGVIVEEALEFAGVALFITVLLQLLRPVRVSIDAVERATPR